MGLELGLRARKIYFSISVVNCNLLIGKNTDWKIWIVFWWWRRLVSDCRNEITIINCSCTQFDYSIPRNPPSRNQLCIKLNAAWLAGMRFCCTTDLGTAHCISVHHTFNVILRSNALQSAEECNDAMQCHSDVCTWSDSATLEGVLQRAAPTKLHLSQSAPRGKDYFSRWRKNASKLWFAAFSSTQWGICCTSEVWAVKGFQAWDK